jgi:aryl-alcohol dehydrogenase-like predicted oxidoreductase
MRYRKLGTAGFEVSEIGYGGWCIGGDWWKGSSDQDALDSMNLAIDLGVTYIDTAIGYGEGHSERLIGQVLSGRSEEVHVGTKIRPQNFNFTPGPGDAVEEAFPSDWIVECTEQSLRNLGVERLDLQMLHVWLDEWADRDEWKETVERLKQQGKIRAFGLSLVFPLTDAHIPSRGIETGLVDACQVVHNIYQQEAEDRLFPLVERANVGVIARCPLDEGALSGKLTPETCFPEGDWRNDYFQGDRLQECCERAGQLDWLVEEGETASLPEAALRYTLSHRAVSTVIVGMRKLRHVRSNVAASDNGPLSEGALKRLKEHAWHHNFWV